MTALYDAVNESISATNAYAKILTDECSHWLDEFHKEAGLSQYMDIREFDAAKGAKLAEFISKSTSAQSQSLGTGGGSEILTF